jgi:hypothetical protein
MTSDVRPEPLAPADLDLRSFPSMLLDVQRLRDSDLAAGDPAHLGLALIAWAVSWHQLPAGSLPNNDAVLARLMGFGRDLKGWRGVREHALHGYVLCSDDRLYHPVVIEKATECYERNMARSRKAQKAAQARWEQSSSNAQASTKHHAQAVLVHSVSTPQADAQVVHKQPPSNANRTEQKVTEQKVTEQKVTEQKVTENRTTRSQPVLRASHEPKAEADSEKGNPWDSKPWTDVRVQIVTSLRNANMLFDPDLPPDPSAVIRAWCEDGLDPSLCKTLVQSVVTNAHSNGQKIGLPYIAKAVSSSHSKRTAGVGGATLAPIASERPKLVAREDAVCEGDKPMPDVTAHNMIDLWERGGPWAPPLGMRPDQFGCRVPMDILRARGYRDDAGRMSDRYLELRAEARAKRDLVRNSVQPIPKSTNGAQHP